MRHFAACLALLSCVQCQAGTVSGAFQGIANIEVQKFVKGQQVSDTNYSAVPSTLNFAIAANGNIGSGSFQFSLTDSVFSLDSTNPDPLYHIKPINPFYLTFITDGAPGQSADSASGSMRSSVYHLWYLQAGVRLTDPTGEYIGPNGNGDLSNVLATAQYVYQPWDSTDTGQTYTVSFTTDPPVAPLSIAPEPSSMVMLAIGFLAILARILSRP